MWLDDKNLERFVKNHLIAIITLEDLYKTMLVFMQIATNNISYIMSEMFPISTVDPKANIALCATNVYLILTIIANG